MRRALGVLIVGSLILSGIALPARAAEAGGLSHRCATSYRIIHVLQRDSRSGSATFDRVASRDARRAMARMSRLQASAPGAQSARLAAAVRTRFRDVLRSARLADEHRATSRDARRAVRRYVATSSEFMRDLARACGRSRTGHRAFAVSSEALYPEQEGHLGVNTFTNYHNASGLGPRIDAGAWVQVSCKVYDPYIQSVNPDGYWYRIASAPWNDAYYSPANTFMNGDPWGGPYTHNTDFAVPDCGSVPAPAPAPAPAPTATLSQGPAAPFGYRYAVTVEHFAANSSVSVSCRDSTSPGGFYTFSLPTDGNGHGFTQSYCYSGDGPDHWVVVNGSVESNHASWSGGGAPAGGGSTGGGASTGGGGANTGGGSTGGGSTGGGADTCVQYHGSRIADERSVAASLFGHYLEGLGDPVVIDWSYFSRNSSFVKEAKSLHVGQLVSGWQAPFGTDMYDALGHFTIERDTADCYLVYDHYDFRWNSVKAYVVFFPFWAIQIFGAREFDEHASGKL